MYIIPSQNRTLYHDISRVSRSITGGTEQSDTYIVYVVVAMEMVLTINVCGYMMGPPYTIV